MKALGEQPDIPGDVLEIFKAIPKAKLTSVFEQLIVWKALQIQAASTPDDRLLIQVSITALHQIKDYFLVQMDRK